jgi:hypothetical protein
MPESLYKVTFSFLYTMGREEKNTVIIKANSMGDGVIRAWAEYVESIAAEEESIVTDYEALSDSLQKNLYNATIRKLREVKKC